MKTVRFLILAVFVLSLCMSAAPAGAAGTSMGYIALVTQANPKMPLAAQAQMEFERLAPTLLAAQKSGYLLDFNTEFHAGIVMLRFAGTTGAASAAARVLERPVYGNVKDALKAVPHQPRTGRVSAAAITAQFWIDAYESCFGGSVPVNAHIIAILRDNANNLQAKTELNEQDDGNADGSFGTCFDWSTYNQVVPGYRVTFKVYDTTGGTLLGAFTAKAPILVFSTLNKATAQITGTGPAGKAFDLYWGQPKLNAANDWNENTVSGMVSGAGKWSGDVSTGTIRGDAYISVTVYQTANIAFTRDMLASRILCRLGGNYCDIHGFPYQSLTLKILQGGTTYTFSGQADAWGWFGASLYTPAGMPIKIKAGDQVQGTNVALYTQPALAINAFDFVNDIVSGKAPPNKFFEVGVGTYSNSMFWYWAGSNSLSDFSVDTTLDFDLLSTETSQAEIWYRNPVTGNITDFTRVYAP